MADTLPQLLQRYGTLEAIPNRTLYDFLQFSRQDLVLKHEADVERSAAAKKAAVKGGRSFKLTDYAVPNMTLGKEVRRRCEQDLEWLGGYMCWETNPEGANKPIDENLMNRENHGQLIDFFVQKDKSKSIKDQSPIKNRLMLLPRGFIKTTWNIADTVQWVLNFPDIRILFLTAADDLATSILTETKGHFIIRDNEPTLMNMFFPEFCLEDKDAGNMFEFTCPVWAARQVRRREPTIMASSITSTLSGYHMEVLKADDSVSNRNSENEEQCLKVLKNFAVNKKLLRPFGYCDKIGTRYHEEDMYGHDLEKVALGEFETISGPGWEILKNVKASTHTLVGRAITIKPEVLAKFEQLNTRATYADAGEDGCILLAPNVLSYEYLVAECAKDPIAFEAQMNQNPRPPAMVVFDRPMLKRATVPFHALPRVPGPLVQFWDFAFSAERRSDFSVGVCGMWDLNSTCFVVDMKRDHYTPTNLAKTVVDFALEHKPFVVGIEDAGGSKMLHPYIMVEARKRNYPELTALLARIDWVKAERDKNAKKMRMRTLQQPITDGFLKFLNGLPNLQTLYEEFEKCLTSGRKDDIPDAIARLYAYTPRVSTLISDPSHRPLFASPEERARYLEERWAAQAREAWPRLLFEDNVDAYGRPGNYIPPSPSDLTVDPDSGSEPYDANLDNCLGSLFG